MLRWMLFLGWSLLVLVAGCSKVEEQEFPDKIPARPVMLFTDTTYLDFYDGPHLMWKLKTAHLERWGGNDRIFVRPILVDIYDSTGKRAAFLSADSGNLDGRMTVVSADGHVFAFTPGGASVRADSLTWSKRQNQVRTDSRVRVVTEEGDVLMGQGFVSDARLDNWQILANVTAIFQDAARRARDADSAEAEQSRVGPAQAVVPADSTKNAVALPVRPQKTPGVKPSSGTRVFHKSIKKRTVR